MKRRFSAKSGLTLLELLISLGLLALVAAGLTSAMGLGIRLYDRSLETDSKLVDASNRIRLRGLLTNAVSPTQIAPFPVKFEGSPIGFSFTTLKTSGIEPRAAALRIHVDAGETFTLSIGSLDDTGTESPKLDMSLSQKPLPLQFSYFDSHAVPQAWLPDWTDETRLPLLVRITTNAGPADWPEFTVRPSLGQNLSP